MVAGVMILCMTVADASLYVKYAGGIADQSDLCVVEESHELEKAYADGIYDGTNSDSEHGDEKYVKVTEQENIDEYRFNILEIVPTEKKGVVGYSIGGCEPFDGAKEYKVGNDILVTEKQMRAAYMDAFINPSPGSSNAKSWDYINTNIGMLNSKMAESGSLSPFVFEPVTVKGYYLKVGTGLGVYAKGDVIDGDQVMYSKFYNYSSSRSYEYIFVESETESSTAGAINVSKHKRMRYTNNEKFLRDVFGLGSIDAAKKWKEEHEVDVTVRTPMSVTIDDIEAADVIIVNNGNNMDYYECAVKMYNIAHGATGDSAISNGKDVVFSSAVDFTDFKDSNGNTVSGFEKVLKIYERVVVREDVAFIGSRNCINGTTFDTNMRKLMCMLFFVGRVEEGTERAFAGRDIFMNYIKRYGEEPGTKYLDASKPSKSGDPDRRYIQIDNPTYADLRNAYESNKNGSERKLHADFRAPSLRNNDYYNGKPYMHMLIPGQHVGHPLVLSADKAIVGGSYVDGSLQPKYDADVAKANQSETLRVKSHLKYELTNSGIPEKDIWESKDKDGNKIYCYSGAYNSMSNATDYAYVDDSGTFHVLTKYSSNSSNGPYWFKIDADDGIDGEYAYRRINWNGGDYSSWPWYDGGSAMGKWVFAKYANGNNANLHMYYDYITWGAYRPGNVPNGDQFYKNEALEAENALFKGNSDLIKKAVGGREVKREKDVPVKISGKVEKNKDYYISMNILNGDGVNKSALPGSNNKVIYYNQYEYENNRVSNWEASNGKAYIPVSIRIRSSCKLGSIVLYANNKSTTPLVTYSFGSGGTDVGKTKINVTGSGTYGGRTIELEPDNELDGMGIPTLVTTNDHTPVYTYNVTLYDVMNNLYITKRNAKFVVQFNAIAPDGSTKSIEDTITFVKRDFFMLD